MTAAAAPAARPEIFVATGQIVVRDSDGVAIAIAISPAEASHIELALNYLARAQTTGGA